MIRLSSLQRALAAAIFLVFLLCGLVYHNRLDQTTLTSNWGSSSSKNVPIGDCSVDIGYLHSLGFNHSVDYARWNIRVTESKKFTGFSESLDVPIPEFNRLELDTDATIDTLPQCPGVVNIEVPKRKAPVDASHLMFGVATTIDRLDDSLEAISRWAGGTKARVIALVESDDSLNTTAVMEYATELDVTLQILENDEEFLDRYYRLTRILFELHDESTQWAVIIDDDTFFPSMEGLVAQLATYDATKPYYIGAPTENMQQMASFTYMGYGGAGVFLSMPLLQEIDVHFDDCFEYKDHGDKRVSKCIYRHTTTKLTWDRHLFQLDLSPDGSGFYEAGRQLPLSVHHWKSENWFPTNIVGMSQVADICGHECQLQRWRITDDWYFINGFSVVQYSGPQTPEDLASMEQTWSYSWKEDESYEYSLGPLRPRDDGKVSYRLLDAVSANKQVRQYYLRQQDEWSFEEEPESPQVLEVVWTLAK
ncbi:hypothetical protein N7520_003740 [Penicillium odoratum]|uniref:uncharacterized protein n=1 Tax=Penicillium odoratum TaxID=1167516 RepID=UPI0025480BE4|nr:uncharacterized protein N7520_003740 [Penicillium odoratum]KAJ5769181.1 hypothetical protein N7520_003740 [Penicillium odoratum]